MRGLLRHLIPYPIVICGGSMLTGRLVRNIDIFTMGGVVTENSNSHTNGRWWTHVSAEAR